MNPKAHFLKPIAAVLLLSCVLCSCQNHAQIWKEQNARKIEWAKVCEPYAMMSFLAYHHADERVKREEASTKKKQEQIYEQAYREELKAKGWKQLATFHRPAYKGRDADNPFPPSSDWNIHCPPPEDMQAGQGLFLEVWENARQKPRELVIAFEGSNSELVDWATNLRALRIFNRSRHADQYEFARPMASDLIDRFTKGATPGSVRIVTTGHSLGGGLAQGVFYANAHRKDHIVDQAIVFNPSPMTGYFDVPNQHQIFESLTPRKTFPHFRVLRVFERGEILAIVRSVASLFTTSDSLIQTLKFDSEKKSNFISQHSMLMLSETIRSLAREIAEPMPTVQTCTYKGEYGKLIEIKP